LVALRSFFALAANAKISEALSDLAKSMEKGEGVQIDLKRAFELYVDAALRGHHGSVFEVGRCYYYGIGVSEDRSCADIWLERAEELGVFESLKGDEC